MSETRKDQRGRTVLLLLVLLGALPLVVPFFLTPPAFLELALRDSVFQADLSGRPIQMSDESSGASRIVATENTSGNVLIAQVGRIRSGSSAVSMQVDGYQPATKQFEALPMQHIRVPIDLVPTFGRLELTLQDATRANAPVAGVVKGQGVTPASQPRPDIVVDLPPGKHRLSAESSGFCTAEREFDVRERVATKGTFPLSRDLGGNEVARLVLNWPAPPQDLDAHLRRQGTSGRNNATHVFFAHKEATADGGTVVARLDVDKQQPGGYETVTVYAGADGTYEYYVHLYAGQGTIGGSKAQVEVYTKGCQRKAFSVSPGCSDNVWQIGTLRIDGGVGQFAERQTCEPGVLMTATSGNIPAKKPPILDMLRPRSTTQ